MKIFSIKLNNRTFYSKLAPLPVDNCHILVPKIVENMHRFSRADMTKQVGTWSTYRQSTFLYQLTGIGMLRRSQTNKACLGSDNIWQDIEVGLQNHSKGPRPELTGQGIKDDLFTGLWNYKFPCLLSVVDMHDDRVSQRPFLGLVYFQQCFSVKGIGSQSIHSLGRKGNKFT